MSWLPNIVSAAAVTAEIATALPSTGGGGKVLLSGATPGSVVEVNDGSVPVPSPVLEDDGLFLVVDGGGLTYGGPIQDYATKAYADAADAVLSAAIQAGLNGLDVKMGVRLVTIAALPACTAAGSGVGKTLTGNANGALTVDGVAVALNDRVGVTFQGGALATPHADNGIYKQTQVGTGSVPFILTRATDADASAEVTQGMFFPVAAGTKAGYCYALVTADPITLDTTTLAFTEILGPVVAGSETVVGAWEKATEAEAQAETADKAITADRLEAGMAKFMFQADDGTCKIVPVAAALTVDISTTGAGGRLSTDSEDASTSYDIWLVWGSSPGAKLMMVKTATAAGWALPSTYTHRSRVLTFGYNDASSDLLDFLHVGQGEYVWLAVQTLLSGGTATGSTVAIPTFGNSAFEYFGYIQATNAQVTSRTITISLTASGRTLWVKAADSAVDVSPAVIYIVRGSSLRYVWSGAVTTGASVFLTGWKI